MIIDSTTIGMESARTYSSISKDAQLAGVLAWGMPTFAEFLPLSDVEAEMKAPTKDTVSEEVTGKDRSSGLADIIESMKTEGSKRLKEMQEDEIRKKLSDATLKYLLRLLYGDDWKEKYEAMDCGEPVNGAGKSGIASPADFQTEAFKMSSCHFEYESESTVFKTTGTAVTADGREISFDITAEMSREFIEYSGVEIMSDPMFADPLVINLDANIADVSDQKFFFDIDSDGVHEEISMLGTSSGYLALDRNGDGSVNDGSELFGTVNGNGFSELAAYDSDGNGWIDEADDIFAKLKIWKADANGGMSLVNIKELGIGALCLGNIGTEFSMKDNENVSKAVIRNSGMFLFEDGRAGTMQQIDMAVDK